MIGDRTTADLKCQAIRGEHPYHFQYDKTDDVTIRYSWAGDFVEEKHSSKQT